MFGEETPILGKFDVTRLKKRTHYRSEVLEDIRKEEAGGTKIIYSFDEMLSRAFNLMHSQNPDAGGHSRRIALPQFKISKKSKKTIFENFTKVCEIMKRDPEHVKQYICAEQNTDASIDGNGGLVITGRFQPQQLEKFIAQYILTYVKCPVCCSTDTRLDKQNRLLFIKCNQCTAQRSVQQIKTGFHATTKASRKRGRA